MAYSISKTPSNRQPVNFYFLHQQWHLQSIGIHTNYCLQRSCLRNLTCMIHFSPNSFLFLFFSLSFTLFHSLAFLSNTAVSSILIPCQSHINSSVSIDLSLTNPTNLSSFTLEKTAYFLLSFFIVPWGPASPVHLLHVDSFTIPLGAWLSLSFTGYSLLLKCLVPNFSLYNVFF